MRCRNIASPSTIADTDIFELPPRSLRLPPNPQGDSSDTEKGIILAWESCGRVVSTERADFFEFVAVNLLFACISIGIVFWRSKKMKLLHARQLAARIGIAGRRR